MIAIAAIDLPIYFSHASLYQFYNPIDIKGHFFDDL